MHYESKTIVLLRSRYAEHGTEATLLAVCKHKILFIIDR